ncbi:hypothetical protein TDB9533_03140 [Thalassocella blandensis]|nr:hypothetical protein TDB9533_03140 [Thalassocella blandensis]
MNVLETNVLHASDVVYWLDGTTHSDPNAMQRIAHPLEILLEEFPKDLRLINSSGKTGLLRKPTLDIIDGRATEAQRSFTTEANYAVVGSVQDPKNFYNARRFTLSAGNANGHGIVLYPTPMGSRVTAIGGLYASLRWDGNNEPVVWAIAALSISIPGMAQPQIYRGQTDHRGELIIPWSKIPPLSTGQSHYSATLSLQALDSARGGVPIDPSSLVAAELESLSSATTFSNLLTGINVIPGERLIIRSAAKDHLTVKPS